MTTESKLFWIFLICLVQNSKHLSFTFITWENDKKDQKTTNERVGGKKSPVRVGGKLKSLVEFEIKQKVIFTVFWLWWCGFCVDTEPVRVEPKWSSVSEKCWLNNSELTREVVIFFVIIPSRIWEIFEIFDHNMKFQFG